MNTLHENSNTLTGVQREENVGTANVARTETLYTSDKAAAQARTAIIAKAETEAVPKKVSLPEIVPGFKASPLTLCEFHSVSCICTQGMARAEGSAMIHADGLVTEGPRSSGSYLITSEAGFLIKICRAEGSDSP